MSMTGEIVSAVLGGIIGAALTAGLLSEEPPRARTVLCVVMSERYEQPFVGVGLFYGRELVCRLQ